MELKGQFITLRPATLRQRPLFFRWATQSDATPFWYGQLYGDDIPTYEIFRVEWPDYYFTGKHPERGRSFLIYLGSRPIGQINYNQIHQPDRSADLDIIIGAARDQGKGYGADAIRTLTQHLFREMNVRRCVIEVVPENPRAVRAYQKAGYEFKYSYTRDGIKWYVLEMLAEVPELLPARVSA
jgi:RimJ/RimL family protein N-acetyltransferase